MGTVQPTMIRTHARSALALVACVLALAGCSDHTPRVTWRLLSVSADGRALRIEALRGQCGGKAYARTRETDITVTVDVFQHTHGAGCASVGIPQNVTVRLKTPLGNRVLLGCSPVAGAVTTGC